MHGHTKIKIIDAKQALETRLYTNTKRKLLKTNAAIWFNKKCKEKQIKPKYINIKSKNNSTQDKKTITMAIKYRINQELKYLYSKKQKLNTTLYKAHLLGAHKWKKSWDTIKTNTDNQLTMEAEEHYKKLKNKIQQLQKTQQTTREQHKNNNQFYSRTENLTNISFNTDEINLLNKGLQHSIARPINTCWNDIIMDTEQAIKKLDPQLQEPYRILAAQKLQQIQRNSKTNNTTKKKEDEIIKNIRNKLNLNNATITRADKGKTTVIIDKEAYNRKIQQFIQDNSFQHLKKDPTNK